MKLFRYLRYFLYIAGNWNVRIAWHLVWEEARGEKKYGICTCGAVELKSLEAQGIDTSHTTIYMPVSYGLAETVFERIRPAAVQHLVDIGCGKGRVMCIAARYGIRKISGIDISPALCADAEVNTALTAQHFPEAVFSISVSDARSFAIPRDADCIFFFNPFDEVVMKPVVENICRSLAATPRRMTVIYANPLYKYLFTEAGFTEEYHSKTLKYLEISILQKDSRSRG